MSFVHISFVGHFNLNKPETIWTRPLPTPSRPIDQDSARALLATYGEAVGRCVCFEGGCACCEWSAAGVDMMERVREYADRLAGQQGATVVETPPPRVRYPPEAVRAYEEAVRAYVDRREREGRSGP